MRNALLLLGLLAILFLGLWIVTWGRRPARRDETPAVSDQVRLAAACYTARSPWAERTAIESPREGRHPVVFRHRCSTSPSFS